MAKPITESEVEDAALAWLESLGYTVKHGLEIAPGELAAERTEYGQVVLERRLRDALARLNPDLPPEALEDAFRKALRAEGATETRNRGTLLPKIASGELHVKEAHEILECSA